MPSDVIFRRKRSKNTPRATQFLALSSLTQNTQKCDAEALTALSVLFWALQKHIDEDIRQRVLDEVDDEEYLSVLRPLLKQKRKSTKAKSDYELNQKLVRFALSRGFTFDIIRQCLLDNLDNLDNLE